MKQFKIVDLDKFIRFCTIMFVIVVMVVAFTWFPVMYYLAGLFE